jgi:CRP/FNR family transcriptional regulator
LPCDDGCAACARRSHGFLALWEGAEVHRIERVRRPRSRGKGTILFRQGQPARDVHCVRDAVLKLTHASPSGRETIVGIVGPGEVVGLSAAIGSSVHPYTAQILVEGVCCTIRFSDLRLLLGESRSLARALLAMSIRETERLVRQIGVLAGSKLAPKLATLLIELSGDEHASVLGRLTRGATWSGCAAFPRRRSCDASLAGRPRASSAPPVGPSCCSTAPGWNGSLARPEDHDRAPRW